MPSAGNTRGLIEALEVENAKQNEVLPSAGNTRGLIEAAYPAARRSASWTPSAGNTRGLIEAAASGILSPIGRFAFRGEYPRPH